MKPLSERCRKKKPRGRGWETAAHVTPTPADSPFLKIYLYKISLVRVSLFLFYPYTRNSGNQLDRNVCKKMMFRVLKMCPGDTSNIWNRPRAAEKRARTTAEGRR